MTKLGNEMFTEVGETDKLYITPKLLRYGSIQKLTLGSGTKNGDGGSHMVSFVNDSPPRPAHH